MSILSGKTGLFAFLALGLVALGALVIGTLATQAGMPASVLNGNTTGKIVNEVLKDTENGQQTSFVILLSDQADLSKAYSMQNQDARGWYVYNTLKSYAEKTQAPLRAFLAARGVPYQAFWAANMLVVTGDRSLVESVAARSDVRIIESNKPEKWVEEDSVANLSAAPLSPDAPEWGVQNVNAPALWALGYTGQGIVIGNQDTGMRWTHQALKPQYRGWDGTTADHNYNWHDSIHSGGGICGADSLVPCDDSGHGTHTTGTTVGYDGAANQVGVAPGAKWIGCRNMDQGNGMPSTYTECFQFFIAPTDLNGMNPNPTLRPYVMNDSWTCPASEGCAATTLQTIVENTQAAGIFVEASAGNSGSGCSSVSDPPAIYAASFSTGAIDISNALASFSSRGPVTADGSNRLKPDISAPGVNVRSTYYSNDSSYANLSGTSMAGPHVVGVVALLWSARPGLARMITETKQLLTSTANPGVTVPNNGAGCGGTPIPNNHFGYGRVDALAAYNASGGGTATAVSTSTPTSTNTPTTQATSTRTSTATNTAVSTSTNTSVPTNTNTAVTNTAVPTDTAVATDTAAPTQTPGGPSATPEPSDTSTSVPTDTPVATDTPTVPAEATNTPTMPVEVTNTPTEPVAATATPTACNTEFTDVPPGSTFYDYIRCMACRGIINGYTSGCEEGTPCFKPNNNVTRGQLAKIVANAAGFDDTPGDQQFQDVEPASTFFAFVWRLADRDIISGYPCGGAGEPCVGPGNLPYFRPNANVTRGQLSKIVSEAAGYTDPAGDQQFQDVLPGSTFYDWIWRLTDRGIMNGYACGGVGEPCVGPANLPYFRPGANATRGQASKIVANTFLPDCYTPAR